MNTNAGDLWKKHSEKMWIELGYEEPSTRKPYTSRRDVKLAGVRQAERDLDVIDLAWATRIKNIPASVKSAPPSQRFDLLKKDYYVNHSQQNVRKPWGNFSTITTSSRVYSFELDRDVLPEELLLLLGHPSPSSDTCAFNPELKAKTLCHLAGEGVSIPVMACAINAIVLKCMPHLWAS